MDGRIPASSSSPSPFYGLNAQVRIRDGVHYANLMDRMRILQAANVLRKVEKIRTKSFSTKSSRLPYVTSEKFPAEVALKRA